MLRDGVARDLPTWRRQVRRLDQRRVRAKNSSVRLLASVAASWS